MTRRRGGTLPVGSTYTAPTAAVRFAVIRRPVPVSAEWRGRAGSRGCGVPQQEAAVRGAGVSRRPGTRPACRAPPGPARGGPRPPGGHRPAHGAARGRATATGAPERTRASARRYRGVTIRRGRGRAHPTGPVRGSALFPRYSTVGGAAPAVAPVPARARTVRYSVYTDLRYTHVTASGHSARALKAVNGGAMRAHARRHT